ncbi:MAG TPA: hypothetical protein VGQ76_07785 [Thermoanaerobaculia bacterium]|jgi:hypothetical protein|nr:hypothetical protein [Thermoanaerobaculia bacterium]
MDFAARYEAGDHIAVWRELIGAGDSVRGELQAQAIEVVRLTMARVRRNLDVLASELSSHGFQFGFYPDGEEVPAYSGPLVPLTERQDETVRQLETVIGGAVPLSIVGLWKWVGAVCFVGYADDWPDYADPIWIEGPASSLNEFPDWKWRCQEGYQDGPFGLIIAPDVCHKDNVSGGAPYEIAVPNLGLDGALRNHSREYYLIDYLRNALAWGGFPGAEGADTPLPNWLMRTAKQLEPF